MFEYIYKTLEEDEVTDFLRERGAEGWRLHTFRVISGKQFAAVMERFHSSEQEDEGDGAMAMKG